MPNDNVRVLAVAGDAAVGKTALIDQINVHLDWNVLGVDCERSEGGDWETLVAKVAKIKNPTIVESILVPKSYKRALTAHDTLVIYCTCDETVRQERILERSYAYLSTDPLPGPRLSPLDFVHMDLTESPSDDEILDLVTKATRKVFAAYTY